VFTARPRHHRDLRSFPTRRSSDLKLKPCRYPAPTSGTPAKPKAAAPPGGSTAGAAKAPKLARRSASAAADGSEVCAGASAGQVRSEEHTSELQSREKLVCRLLLEK